MQWLNPVSGATDEMAGESVSSDAPADRDAHARRAKFFSPEIFGPSK
jgi:hypothetical protein